MNKYTIVVEEIIFHTYKVEAVSEDEAMHKIGESQCGNDEFLIGSQGTWNTYYEVENVEGNEG
jgi:hypothetical protein